MSKQFQIVQNTEGVILFIIIGGQRQLIVYINISAFLVVITLVEFPKIPEENDKLL